MKGEMIMEKQNFEVYAELKIPVFVNVEAENEEQAECNAKLILEALTASAKLNLTQVDGTVLNPKVLDLNVIKTEVMDEEE